MLWGSWAIFFLRLLDSHREKKISRWKSLFVFSTTDVFVPVSQLSTRDLFNFLENLKIKQDIFVLSFSSCSNERYDSPIPDFWNKNVQENVNSWVFGVFYKVNCDVDIRFFDTSRSERCLNCWLVKEIITFLSLGRRVKRLKSLSWLVGLLAFSLFGVLKRKAL